MASSETPVAISGEKTISAAATAEALAAAQRVKSVTIIAKVGNTNNVYIGGSDVASTTNDGIAAGDSLKITAKNWLDLNDIYLDVDTSGEGVDFYAVKA